MEAVDITGDFGPFDSGREELDIAKADVRGRIAVVDEFVVRDRLAEVIVGIERLVASASPVEEALCDIEERGIVDILPHILLGEVEFFVGVVVLIEGRTGVLSDIEIRLSECVGGDSVEMVAILDDILRGFVALFLFLGILLEFLGRVFHVVNKHHSGLSSVGSLLLLVEVEGRTESEDDGERGADESEQELFGDVAPVGSVEVEMVDFHNAVIVKCAAKVRRIFDMRKDFDKKVAVALCRQPKGHADSVWQLVAVSIDLRFATARKSHTACLRP